MPATPSIEEPDLKPATGYEGLSDIGPKGEIERTKRVKHLGLLKSDLHLKEPLNIQVPNSSRHEMAHSNPRRLSLQTFSSANPTHWSRAKTQRRSDRKKKSKINMAANLYIPGGH